MATMKKYAILWLVGACVQSVPAAADDVENLGKALITMRGEVEELQADLDMEKQSHKTQMDALSSQMADLSVENQRRQVAIEKLQQAMVKYEQATAAAETGDDALLPVLLTALDRLNDNVRDGLPFKIEERLAELAKLKTQVETRALAPKKAANRIWAFIEDEMRLSRENGVYSQTIELDGEKHLADVAKLGSVFLYFRTGEDRVGKAVKKGDAWHFVELNSPEQRERISILFDSLKKQIRQGYFELPNPLES